jgi:hypothetical protein
MPCSYRGLISYVNEAVRIPSYRGLQGSTVPYILHTFDRVLRRIRFMKRVGVLA